LTLSQTPRAWAKQAQAAIANDPSPDKTDPAAIETMQISSHGSLLNALVYVAAGPGPHPVVVLLHGFPGNEKNLDLAQAIRRAGWDVLYFNYRGSWGSSGDFSFRHSMEDTQAILTYLRIPSEAKRLRADSARIVLIGHSMGGFMAAYAGAQDPKVEAVGLISAANLGDVKSWPYKPGNAASLDAIAAALAKEGMAPLSGCTPQSLAREILANQQKWNFVDLSSKLASRPILDITSDDGLLPTNEALVDALKKAGAAKVTAIHMTTDHAYSDHRIALETAVLAWLESLRKP
jgi:pimeloyl-ACP methyl ester carboxylesterase